MNIALIGIDGHHGILFEGLRQLEDCRLVAAAKGKPEDDLSVLRRHERFPADARLYDDYRSLLDAESPDIVVVGMPYHRNAEVCVEAARRGCHIMCEKPIATSLEDLERVRETVRASGVRLTSMFEMRCWPAIAAARQAVADGRIGEPVLAFGQKSYRFGASRPAFYKQRKTYGGTIPWVAIHAIDFVRYVTGQRYVRVAGLQANKAHPDYPECEDCGALLFGLANGGQAVITFDYLRPARAPTHGDDRLRVAGTRGVLEIQDHGSRCELVTHDEPPHELPLPPKRQLFVDFVRELRGQGQHIIGPDEPFRITQVALQAREAADRGTVVEL